MFNKVVVGVDEHQGGRDAVTAGQAVGCSCRGSHAGSHPRSPHRAFDPRLRRRAGY